MRKYEKRRLIRQWIGFFVILSGFIVICLPFIAGFLEGQKQSAALDQAIEQMEELQKKGSVIPIKDTEKETESETESEPESESETAAYKGASASQLEELFEVCRRYNQNLCDTRQVSMNSLASTEHFDIDTRNYGFTDNVIGTLWVPRMDIKLALYLGANGDNMARGGAVFGKSSIPMRGDISVNTAIAGHRGWRGTAMFRDIQTMQIGDPIYIETPWDQLVYRVCELRIVPKDNNEWCMIQPGRNLITLMTCHPYTQNYQRYIVFAELTEEAFKTEEEAEAEALATRDESPREVTEKDENGNEKTITVDTASIDPTGEEYGASWSNLMILADSQLRIVMYVVGAFTLIIFLWLLGRTIRYLRQR